MRRGQCKLPKASKNCKQPRCSSPPTDVLRITLQGNNVEKLIKCATKTADEPGKQPKYCQQNINIAAQESHCMVDILPEWSEAHVPG